MRDDAFHQAAFGQDLADLKPLHPRTVKGTLERMLEDERVRAEEPPVLKQLSQAVFAQTPPTTLISDWQQEQILTAQSGEALDQALAYWLKTKR